MYLLDTNVISELRRPERASSHVTRWASSIDPQDLFLSAVSLMELEIGAGLVLRRDKTQGEILWKWIGSQVKPIFSDRILPFGMRAAEICAGLHVPDRRPERDAMIAATALEFGLVMVTRNTADFEPLGVRVLNPWQA